VSGILGLRAELPERLELPLELVQLADTFGDVPDVLVEEGVDPLAVLRGGVLEAQQHADLVERDVEAPAVANELHPPGVLGTVEAEVAVRARRLGEEPLPLVVAESLDLDAGRPGEVADLRADSSCHRVTASRSSLERPDLDSIAATGCRIQGMDWFGAGYVATLFGGYLLLWRQKRLRQLRQTGEDPDVLGCATRPLQRYFARMLRVMTMSLILLFVLHTAGFAWPGLLRLSWLVSMWCDG
jgi:hypothetical protein